MSDLGTSAGEQGEPVGWLETVTLANAAEPVNVVLDGREGHRVFVRQADPRDIDVPRIPMYDGDELVVMTALSHVGHHLTGEVGRTDDYLTSARIVPVRREPGRVYARTLRHGEPDAGHRVHVRPGDDVIFEQGAVAVELDAIDAAESVGKTGYIPITPVLWTWLAMGPQDPAKARYLLAAARRLDTANRLLGEVEKLRLELAQGGLGGPAIRHAQFGLIGAVELAVVALGRVVDMIDKAATLINATVPVPTALGTKQTALTEIRNAYEHIEDRALGQVREKPHPDALTIFNYEELLVHDRITYGSESLDLQQEVPALIAEARTFLKAVAADA